MRRWPYTFGVCLSAAIGITMVYLAWDLDVPIRDPEGFLGPAYVRLPLIGIAFFAAGIIPAALWEGKIRGFSTAVRRIIREEWSLKRVGYIITGLLVFYVAYVSYRNIKSDRPLLRPDRYDVELLELDHWMMFGNKPSDLLHQVLGTGIANEILALAYVAYLPLIPLTLGAFLVWGKDISLGAWYATALSLNWVLGTVSYYILPTLGPAFEQPGSYNFLPDTAVSALQNSLMGAAFRSYEDPASATYGIAGFASLHVSVVFTACLFFERTHQRRFIRIAGWIFFALTVLATIYFGWHYLVDDIAGMLIGWLSIVIGAWASGNSKRQLRRRAEEAEAAGISGVESDLSEVDNTPSPLATATTPRDA